MHLVVVHQRGNNRNRVQTEREREEKVVSSSSSSFWLLDWISFRSGTCSNTSRVRVQRNLPALRALCGKGQAKERERVDCAVIHYNRIHYVL